MIRRKSLLVLSLFAALAMGCSTGPSSTNAPMEVQVTPSLQPASPVEFESFDVPDARSVSMAGTADGDLYLLYGTEHSLYLSRSADGGRTFDDAVLASADSQAHVLSVERPALAVDNENHVGVAWLVLPDNFQGADIWFAFSENGGQSFNQPVLAAAESSGEVAMVQAALDDTGNPHLAWLSGNKLMFTRSLDGGRTFTEPVRVGGGACECCQPSVLVQDQNVYIAYRGVEAGGTQGDIRDILLIRSSDGGKSFSPATRVSDTHWYLPACPIAGPSAALHEGNLFIAFMDGRFEPAGTFSRGDIWLASSNDDGSTFSSNIRISFDQDSHHTLPSIAIGPGGRIHAAWESLSQGGGGNNLHYTFSDNNGQTFAPLQAIADNSDESRGNPGKAVIVVSPEGNVALAWLDRSGAHVASWMDTR